MVAVFDSIPKHVTMRMGFSGKVEDAAAWAAVLSQMLKQRLTPWQYAVVSGALRQDAVARRNDAEQIMAAATLNRAYAAYLVPLIDRDVAEGKTLVSLVISRVDLMENGVMLQRYIASRGMASTTMQVAQMFAEIAKVKLSFSGGLVEHEETAVKIKGMWERIDPQHRGGPTRLQEMLIAAMPVECLGERIMIESQLEMQLHTTGTYPNAHTLLRMLSPLIRTKHTSHVAMHVQDAPSGQKRKAPGGGGGSPDGGGPPGGRNTFRCANCLGGHQSSACSFKCPECGESCCGAAMAGRTCCVAETVFPARVLDAKGKPIPYFLYTKLKSKWTARHGGGSGGGGGGGGGVAPTAPAAPVTPTAPTAATHATMAAAAEEAMFERFEAASLSGVQAFTFALDAPERAYDEWGGAESWDVMPMIDATEPIEATEPIIEASNPNSTLLPVLAHARAVQYAPSYYMETDMLSRVSAHVVARDLVVLEMAPLDEDGYMTDAQGRISTHVAAVRAASDAYAATLRGGCGTESVLDDDEMDAILSPTLRIGVMPTRMRAMCFAMRAGDVGDGGEGSVMLADSCTNAHVVRRSSVLMAGHVMGPVGMRGTIGGANALAPTAVVGELDLPVYVPTQDGSGIYVLLKGVLVTNEAPHDVLDTQEMFARHGWRFRFEGDYSVQVPGGSVVPILRCSSGLPVVLPPVQNSGWSPFVALQPAPVVGF